MIRILLVDDDRVDREISEYYLKKLGDEFEISCCGSSVDALSQVGTRNFDCIISDLQMPEMNGLEFLSRLRESGDTTPFIILSGQSDKEVAIEAFSADADDYFPKDSGFVLYERLAHSVRKVVKAHKEHSRMLALQKETELAKERLQNIKKKAKLGSWEYDLKKDMVSCCPFTLRLLDLENRDFKGSLKEVTANFHQDDFILLDRVRLELQNGSGSFSFRHRVNLENGLVRVVEANGKAILDDNKQPIRIVGTSQDITSLYNLEKALSDSYIKFKESFSRAAVGMVLIDMNYKIVEANAKFCDMFSFRIDDLLNKSMSNFDESEAGHSNAEILAKIEMMVKGEITSFSKPGVFELSDGTRIQCEVTSSLITDEEGIPRNLLTQFLPY